MAVKFNMKNLNLVLEKPIERAILPAARRIAKERFESSLNQLVSEIEADPVSQEINAGNDVVKSKFIKGGGKYGANLFSFIGFEAGSEPVKELVSYIRKSFKINLFNIKKDGNKYNFQASFPSEGDVKSAFPFPDGWSGGRSWITGIERGITGAINYIRKLGEGRSGGGVQIENEVDKTFIPKRDYFATKYRAFVKRLKQ
jgi:hypothetical protein